MQRFNNILVGVDFSHGGKFGSELPASTAEAVERSIWLAKSNGARLTFCYVHDDSDATLASVDEKNDSSEILREARDALERIRAQAAKDQVTADLDVRFGKSWRQLIFRVLENRHDLVVAGTRNLGAVSRLLLGSTGMQLLRLCPCPVWITKPQSEAQIKTILVAHCLRKVGDLAMELACSMAQLQGANLHVLHSLEFPELACALPARVPAEKSAKYRSNAETHIRTQLAGFKFAQPPKVHIVTDRPEFAILEEVERHDIELVVLGTVARTGISGLITGNTAEKVLSQVSSSILAVKPAGFMSPVHA